MKIQLLDKVLEIYGLDINKEYNVIRTETIQDDLYYIIINNKNKEVGVHELLAKEINR